MLQTRRGSRAVGVQTSRRAECVLTKYLRRSPTRTHGRISRSARIHLSHGRSAHQSGESPPFLKLAASGTLHVSVARPTADPLPPSAESGARISGATGGRPVRRQLFHVQNRRNPLRCQAMTVSGFTITIVVRQPLHTRDSHAQSHPSAFARSRRRSCDRCNTSS
jgi:hypothetical protein